MSDMHPFEIVRVTLLTIMLFVITYIVSLAVGIGSVNEDCVKFGKFYVRDNEFTCTLVKPKEQ